MEETDYPTQTTEEKSFIDNLKAKAKELDDKYDIIKKLRKLNSLLDGLREPYKMAAIMVITLIAFATWLKWVLVPAVLVTRTLGSEDDNKEA